MLNRESLSALKKLCHISCTEEEDRTFLVSLGRILKYVEQLQEIETDNVPPCDYPLNDPLPLPLREDIIGDLLPRDTYLANAPDQIGGMIRVPPVLREPS